MSKYLCCGIKCPVETVGDVDRHSSPAKLFKCFGIQNQEERTLVLQRIKTQEKLIVFSALASGLWVSYCYHYKMTNDWGRAPCLEYFTESNWPYVEWWPQTWPHRHPPPWRQGRVRRLVQRDKHQILPTPVRKYSSSSWLLDFMFAAVLLFFCILQILRLIIKKYYKWYTNCIIYANMFRSENGSWTFVVAWLVRIIDRNLGITIYIYH